MRWHEFEALAGYEVTLEDYEGIIEPMYLATDLGKAEFIALLNKERFALPSREEMLEAMRKEARHLKDICGRGLDYDSERKLEELAQSYAERFYGGWATIERGYEYPGERGCSYPTTAVMCDGGHVYEKVGLAG